MRSDKKTRIYLHIRMAPKYFAALRKMELSIKQEKALDDKLFIPFVITCAAALEAMLNDCLIKHAFENFDAENYRKIAEALVSINLRGKLDSIVSLVSYNKFMIKKDSRNYQQLIRIISLRNFLMHGKSFLNQYNVSIRDLRKGKISIRMPMRNKQKINLSINECTQFLKALQAFDHVLWSESWDEGEMMIKNQD